MSRFKMLRRWKQWHRDPRRRVSPSGRNFGAPFRPSLELLEPRRLLAAPVAVDDDYEVDAGGLLEFGEPGGWSPGLFTPGNILVSNTQRSPQTKTIRE